MTIYTDVIRLRNRIKTELTDLGMEVPEDTEPLEGLISLSNRMVTLDSTSGHITIDKTLLVENDVLNIVIYKKTPYAITFTAYINVEENGKTTSNRIWVKTTPQGNTGVLPFSLTITSTIINQIKQYCDAKDNFTLSFYAASEEICTYYMTLDNSSVAESVIRFRKLLVNNLLAIGRNVSEDSGLTTLASKICLTYTNITSANKSYKASAKTKTLTATLKDTSGTQLQNKTLVFTIDDLDGDGSDEIYTATTSSTGVASVSIAVTTAGTYYFTAKFEGDDTYFPCTGPQAKLIIK